MLYNGNVVGDSGKLLTKLPDLVSIPIATLHTERGMSENWITKVFRHALLPPLL